MNPRVVFLPSMRNAILMVLWVCGASSVQEQSEDVAEFSFDDLFDDSQNEPVPLLDDSHPVIRIPMLTVYSRHQLLELGPSLSGLVLKQMDRDRLNPHLTPALTHSFEDILLEGVLTRIRVGELISQTSFGTVFAVADRDDLVVKYQTDCDLQVEPLHALLRDAWFIFSLRDTGLVPSMKFLSPPTPLTFSITAKTHFDMTVSERNRCIESQAPVRFMVLERVRMNLYQFVAIKGPSLTLSVEVMRWLFSALETIHTEHGIVHGDIHGGNVVLFRGSRPKLGLIDFGLSVFIEELEINPPDPYERREGADVHCLHSIWELDGFRRSFRDDLVKTVLLGAYLMHGAPFFGYCNQLAKDNEAGMREWKRSGNLFDFPGRTLMWTSKQFEALTGILAHIRLLDSSILAKPNYGLLRTFVSRLT
jgi:hypothetical protein